MDNYTTFKLLNTKIIVVIKIDVVWNWSNALGKKYDQNINLRNNDACTVQWGKNVIWSPADFVRFPTDKEMVGLFQQWETE